MDPIKTVLSNYVVVEPYNLSTFCVDGRQGGRADTKGATLNGPYLQALGGSYHMVALDWLLGGGKADYLQSAEGTFKKMKEKGLRLGVHRGHHGHGDASDCGFADNFTKIVKTLQAGKDEIWALITEAEGSLAGEAARWEELMKKVDGARLDSVPTGDSLIKTATGKYGADLQNLVGEHGEIAAVVNLKRNTTLDVDRNQGTQAFNLDLWHVLDIAKELRMDAAEATLLSLGLYVATEMVLVEQKGKPRLPIVVNK